MTRTLRTALPLIATLTVGSLATTASAMGIYNCTGTTIRVLGYNNDDVVQAIARSNNVIQPGGPGSLLNETGTFAIKVFQTGLIDQMRLSASFLNGRAIYSIVPGRNGPWEVVEGQRC
jgi:hypothetical protein